MTEGLTDKQKANVLDLLIASIRVDKTYHKTGTMQSMAESKEGEIKCDELLERIDKLIKDTKQL